MKIGILTQPLKLNYGGILQAFALQEVLKRMGHDVRTIHIMIYADEKVTLHRLVSYIKRLIQKYLLGKDVPTAFIMGISKKEYFKRSVNINLFVDTHIRLTDKLESYSDLPKLASENFDAIIVGSDQVWVPGNMPTYLLDFTEGWDIKRISYAASFGHSDWRMNAEKTRLCSKYARSFDAISVREDSGVRLCKEYWNVDAVHVLDPTLLLNSEDYLSLVKVENETEKTLFCYILDSDDLKKCIVANIAKVLCAKVVSTLNLNKGINDNSNILPSMDKWIGGIYNADFVITDSFHGTVFSLIFRKQFAVMGNPARGLSRIYSLLKLFGLEDRFIYKISQIPNLLQNEIDYTKIEPIIKKYKVDSLLFLHKSLM